jgi:hypothetical protein
MAENYPLIECFGCGNMVCMDSVADTVWARDDDGVPQLYHAECADEDRVMGEDEVDSYFDEAADQERERLAIEASNGVYMHSVPYEDGNAGYLYDGSPIGG